MKWFNRALRDWRKLLETLPTIVDEKPNPEAVEILGEIDLLLKTRPEIRMIAVRPYLRAFVVAATVALFYVMFYSFGHNNIWLSVKASAVSFTLDNDGPTQVLKELSLKKLVVSPVNTFSTQCEGTSNPLAPDSLDRQGGTATILPSTRMRLNGFELPAHTRIDLGLTAQRIPRVILTYPMSSLKLSGTVDGLQGKGSCDFSIETRAAGLELTTEPSGADLSEPAYGQIPISSVQFDFPQLELGRSLSSIDEGILSFTDILDRKHILDRGSRLSMDLRKGTMADLRISGQQLSLLVQGDASRVLLGYGGNQHDITPTILDWLRSRSRNVELWMGLVYFAAMLFGFGLPEIKGAGS